MMTFFGHSLSIEGFFVLDNGSLSHIASPAPDSAIVRYLPNRYNFDNFGIYEPQDRVKDTIVKMK
jgi:hypothetical protein